VDSIKPEVSREIEFFDCAECQPPKGRKIIMLTESYTCIIGIYQTGVIGWLPVPRIPNSIKAKRENNNATSDKDTR
jgi:hypothetical protein